jgi:hypothetical protein
MKLSHKSSGVSAVRGGMTITPEQIKGRVTSGTVTSRGVRKMPVLTAAAKSRHSTKVMSAKQERRIRAGKAEGKPEDYQQPTDEQRRLGEARCRVEDMRIAKELGID